MSVLDELVAAARSAQAGREATVPLDSLRETARTRPSPKDALAHLRTDGRAVTIVAEVKRATATFADLTGVGDPAVLACFYEAGGAVGVSVVTEPTRYHGCLADLDAVRSAVDVPVMVNDVVVTPYQVHEARAHGADMLLLIVSALTPLALESLVERTHSLGMTAIVEAHTRDEARLAVDAGARVVAVDGRDPSTGRFDRRRFDEVGAFLPPAVVRVAEGGVRGPHDVMDCARAGADVVIVGEAVLRSADPQQFVAELVAAGAHPALRPPSHHREVF